ncbi:uncharacterized protein [Watersipora subatra]|uniref:uncharacterized protein n=1 Tax=Watersipora subatra TaxID=2589382 RepID=UPI00355B0A39
MSLSRVALLTVFLSFGIIAVSSQPAPWCWPRHTLVVYGDPHMRVYGTSGITTCAADGWRTYLHNRYFDLVAHTSSFYVDEIELTFFSHNNRVRYITGTGSIATQLTLEPSNAPVNTHGLINILPVWINTVRIIDFNSLTVFYIRKIRTTYLIAVRTGHCILDDSCGLLIDGCPSDYLSMPGNGRKKRQVGACDSACEGVPQPYRDTCLFDCEEDGGQNSQQIAEISGAVPELMTRIEATDSEVVSTTTGRPTRNPPTRPTRRTRRTRQPRTTRRPRTARPPRTARRSRAIESS